MNTKKNVLGLALVLLAALLVGVVLTNVLDADKNSPTPEEMVFQWSAPKSGAPVQYYEVEIRRGGAGSDDVIRTTTNTNSITVEITDFLVVHEVRARGVDAQGRRGSWSLWSLEYDRDLPDAEF